MTEAEKCLRLRSNRGSENGENGKNGQKMAEKWRKIFFAPYHENLAYNKYINLTGSYMA